MKSPGKGAALFFCVDRLTALTGMSVQEANNYTTEELGSADAVIEVGDYRFAAEVIGTSSSAQILQAIETLKGECNKASSRTMPLIVVPYMGNVGDELCRQYNVSWLDLSGNAWIKAEKLFISVKGETNKFKRRGRIKNIFSAKSSRLIRLLLFDPYVAFRQIQLVRDTGLNQGYVSTVINRMLELEYIDIDEYSMIRVAQPERLYEDWRLAYDFQDHQVTAGICPARGGVQLTDKVAAVLKRNKIRYVATGLAAAWKYTQYATYRLAAFYLAELPEPGVLDEMEFQPLDAGANVWLVVPNDPSVFWRSRDVGGLECAHPLQVCLDLKDYPERSEAAYQELRNEYLLFG